MVWRKIFLQRILKLWVEKTLEAAFGFYIFKCWCKPTLLHFTQFSVFFKQTKKSFKKTRNNKNACANGMRELGSGRGYLKSTVGPVLINFVSQQTLYFRNILVLYGSPKCILFSFWTDQFVIFQDDTGPFFVNGVKTPCGEWREYPSGRLIRYKIKIQSHGMWSRQLL